MKQTAVEFLSEQIRLTNIEGLRFQLWDAIEQAKEMEREQIIDALELVQIIPKEESKQETVEEAGERLYPTTIDSFTNNGFDLSERERLIFINGAKWQQERSYSEEEVLEFTQTMIMQYKFGNNNIEQMDLLKKTLQLFKKK